MLDKARPETTDLDGWLKSVELPDGEVEQLVNHVRDRMIGYFGSESFEVWRAKDGLHRHDAQEVAALAIAKLAPILATLEPGTVSRLVEKGEFGQVVQFPWDNRW